MLRVLQNRRCVCDILTGCVCIISLWSNPDSTRLRIISYTEDLAELIEKHFLGHHICRWYTTDCSFDDQRNTKCPKLHQSNPGLVQLKMTQSESNKDQVDLVRIQRFLMWPISIWICISDQTISSCSLWIAILESTYLYSWNTLEPRYNTVSGSIV